MIKDIFFLEIPAKISFGVSVSFEGFKLSLSTYEMYVYLRHNLMQNEMNNDIFPLFLQVSKGPAFRCNKF